MTSSAHDADLKGNNFRRTIHPQSFIAVAFIFSELDRGGFRSPPPVQKIEKKPGLDRVKAPVPRQASSRFNFSGFFSPLFAERSSILSIFLTKTGVVHVVAFYHTGRRFCFALGRWLNRNVFFL